MIVRAVPTTISATRSAPHVKCGREDEVAIFIIKFIVRHRARVALARGGRENGRPVVGFGIFAREAAHAHLTALASDRIEQTFFT